MKKLILILTVTLSLFSCQKEVIQPNNPTPNPDVTDTINDTIVEPPVDYPDTSYLFKIEYSQTVISSISFIVNADPYSYDFDSNFYGTMWFHSTKLEIGDTVRVGDNVTSANENVYYKTFSVRMKTTKYQDSNDYIKIYEETIHNTDDVASSDDFMFIR